MDIAEPVMRRRCQFAYTPSAERPAQVEAVGDRDEEIFVAAGGRRRRPLTSPPEPHAAAEDQGSSRAWERAGTNSRLTPTADASACGPTICSWKALLGVGAL